MAATDRPKTSTRRAARGASGRKPATRKAGKPAGSTLAIAGAAVAGVAAGLAANLGRKVAVQSVTALSGDWSTGLKNEHAVTLKLLDKIQETRADQKARRTALLTQLKHALGKHAFQEENVIYPALRKHGEAEGADSLNHDHGYVKQHLFDLTGLARDDPAWIKHIVDLRADLERHMREEEETLFPRLQAALDEAANAKLTREMNKEGLKLA